MAEAARVESEEKGRITDEGIARIRERIGQGFEGRRQWNTEISRDAIYHLAIAIGDLSPLYTDEEYAKRTRWGTLLAPPIILNSMDTLRAVGSSGLPEGLPGVHSIWSGSLYEYERPPRLGDRITGKSYLKDVVEKQSKFGGDRRSIYQTYEAIYSDQNGEKVGLRNDTWIRIDREKTREKSKYGELELAKWTPADIEKFQNEYRAQTRTKHRRWRDVKVGDSLGSLLKGPLTPTAEISFESFFGIYLVGNKVAANLYDKHPSLMVPNEQGIPEPPQRVHWDNAFTKNLLGLPGAYDLGIERLARLMQLVTDWVGDDGWLTRIECQYRKFNYMGDATWCRGTVVDKLERDGKKLVKLGLETVNQRDEVTTVATAEAELP